ncbi:DUF3846 domain-containing protein [Nocardia tengchongensis]|uniref:DUF3846 domain-containing protein n=1 Tax=Nocardia tengchongensis TaxID=2055889 RepID=UPI003649ED1F
MTAKTSAYRITAALVLHPDGTLYEVNLKPGRTHLELMREHLNCQRVDVVALTDKVDMWIDDEGEYNHPVNPLATRLARHHGFTWQPYHGPVLLCGVDNDGHSIDLDVDQMRALLTHLADLVA